MSDWDVKNKRIVITGATSGIGRAAATALARQGAEITIVCRSRRKGEAVVAEICEMAPQAGVDIVICDFEKLSDVRAAAERLLADSRPIDVLFNNAGVLHLKRELTVDGIERTFAVNHLGYFLLTTLLLERMQESEAARVVSTASIAHKAVKGRIDFDDLQGEKGYRAFRNYGITKLANILFTHELAKRCEGTSVTANCFHPGLVASGFASNNGILAKLLLPLIALLARSNEKGAETGVYLCASPEASAHSGRYFFDCQAHYPKRFASNDEAAARLWKHSQALTAEA